MADEQQNNPEQSPDDQPQDQPSADEPSGADAQQANESIDGVASEGNDAESALNDAQQAADEIAAETGGEPAGETSGEPQAVDLPNFEQSNSDESDQATALGLLDDVNLNVKIELGRTRMFVEDVLRLNTNSVVELDKAAGDPVDVYVNDQHVARGEVLVVNENFCIRISEIIQDVNTEEAPASAAE